MTWISCLEDMWQQLKKLGYEQIPQLSSSRWIDVYRPMYIVPPGSGKRRAMIIGINYVGQQGQLQACHNDAENVKDYLIKAQGFREEEMLILKDDGKQVAPTKIGEEVDIVLKDIDQILDLCRSQSLFRTVNVEAIV